MLREFAISSYLIVFGFLFNIFKLFPQKNKTVAVTSFGDNVFFIAKAINEISDEEIIILKEPRCNYTFNNEIVRVIAFDIKHPIFFIKSIYHLATGSNILVDNYFGFLAAVNFRKGTTCIQLWHAAGALKKFGLEDPSNVVRIPKAINRFRSVYQQFNYVVVGSEKMAKIFKNSFGLTEEQIIRTGVPRTDIFYNNEQKELTRSKFYKKFTNNVNKKIILYAPTYRKKQLDYQIQLDLEQLYEELSDEYILFLKNHPSTSNTRDFKYRDFVYDVSNYDINELLLVTDLLISDYSSIPFEFALLEKPMIFFSYDLEEYAETNGIIDNYSETVPGPVVSNTSEVIDVIKNYSFNIQAIMDFSNEWNKYSQGNSSQNLASIIALNKKSVLQKKKEITI